MWEQIQKILNERNMTQYKLAKKMNIATGTISDLKLGRIKKPSFEFACKIADALDVTVDDLRTDRKEDKSFEEI
ncbi:helix-turn-helix domain-containing protein [Enterococcus sp. AZ103]|uniref:helix-turn-helix domain-containing protein n=1 Tax=Enterococcus sp. AZ103 TaxID=2774628 RepID=UPI003F236DDC